MVEQTICPNCGQQMDVGNVYITGKAVCTSCGYEGMPLRKPDYLEKIKEGGEAESEKDPLDIHSLVGKLAIIMAGVLVMSVLMPEMRSFLPVSVLGMLLFAASYKLLEK